MWARRLIFDKAISHSRWNNALRRSSQRIVHNQDISNLEIRFADHGKKQEATKPFIKDLFLGSFNTDFMVFPEAQPNDRYLDFISWLKPIEEYISECVNSTEKLNTDDVISHLKQFGVFRASISLPYGGLDCCETEIVKITETLSALPWLGTYFIKNNILPVRLLTKYGTDGQKQKYLPKIATGELMPTICITEKHSRSSINSIDAHLVQRTTSSAWKLNAEKNFVYNGTKADLYLVFAYTINNHMTQGGDMTISLVEANQPGVTCTAIEETVGIKEVPLCTVVFNDVKVPDENVLKSNGPDFNPLVDILSPGRQNIAPQAVTLLRSFLNLLVTHMLDRKHFDQNMWELDAVKMALSEMAVALYTMESLVYFTSALADKYEDQDLMAEKCITETYCANECVSNILKGIKLIGTRSYLKTQPFMKHFEDALSLATFDVNYVDANIYVALLGLQYSGKVMHGDVKKARNFNTYPAFHFTRFWRWQTITDLDLEGMLHPSMENGANALETGITSMRDNVRILFEKHGIDLTDRHQDMFRLSQLVSSIYIMVATLSRASRSYCIGLKNSTEERNMAVQLSCLAQEEMRRLIYEIQERRLIDPDITYRCVAKKLYEEKGYFVTHALERIK